MFHTRITTGSPRVVIKENVSEHGIPIDKKEGKSSYMLLVCTEKNAKRLAPRYYKDA